MLFRSLSSCSSHIDEEYKEQDGDSTVKITSEIIESHLTPLMTKGNDAMKLRFIMEVWKLDDARQSYSILALRREQLAINHDYTTSFIFDLTEVGDYRILFFADFIDNATANNQNYYPDKYYNTSSSYIDESESLKYCGLKSVQIIRQNYCFNTDTRDSFYASVDFYKGSEAVELEKQKLKRTSGKMVIKEKETKAFLRSKSFSVTYTVPFAFNVENASIKPDMLFEVQMNNQSLAGNLDQADYTLFYDYIFSSNESQYSINQIHLIGQSIEDETCERNDLINIPIIQNRPTIISGSYMLVSSDSMNPENNNIAALLSGETVNLSTFYGGLNGRSTEGPSWADPVFLGMVDWMKPASVRYPAGTQANSWDWREGKLMDKDNPKYLFKIEDFVKGLPYQTDIVYVINMVNPTPSTGYADETSEEILKSEAVLNAKIDDMIAALDEFKRMGKLPIAVELGNELYFNNEHAGIYAANPQLYLEHVIHIARAIRNYSPDIHILLCTTKGGSVGRDRWNTAVFNHLESNIELRNLIRGVVQHHYISENYGSLDDITSVVDAEEAIDEGFSYIRSIRSDYENVPNDMKLWITEYGLSKRKEQLGMWTIGLQFLSMSMGWLELGDKIENIMCQHITLDPGILDKDRMELSSVGIAYGEMMRAMSGMNKAERIEFVSENTSVDAIDIKLYGWKFTDILGTEKVLMLNPTSQYITSINLEKIISPYATIKQYWSSTPYPSAAFLGDGIEIKDGGKVNDFIAYPFSLSVISYEN